MKKGTLIFRGKDVNLLDRGELIFALGRAYKEHESLREQLKKAGRFNMGLMGHISNAHPV